MSELEKVCGKCKISQPLENFHRNSSRRDGLSAYCKACRAEERLPYYNNNRERYAEYRRRATQDEKSKKLRAEKLRLDRERHPERHRARQAVWRAVKRGALLKETCRFCGATKVQAHHEDYAKPLDVVWVCFKCHIEQFHGKRTVDHGQHSD